MERDHGHIDQRFSLAGHTWPPRQIRSSSSSTSYCCGYCKREFRSPQGLGGHMNVHRWDRARLIHGHQCSAHRLPSPPNNPSPSGRVIDPRISSEQMPHCTGNADGSATAVAKQDNDCRFTASASSNTTKNFESGVGVCSHQDGTDDRRLDLELRLGCS
ncbi:hypothetical protein PR202_gb22674 [Eleusine coracana subsp. coracana]|uniref:C2H2-type domain-containing protein n=1 Tax=Eleusine coracana subsp. coracana TaxID=191504 RepID=A0AAV5FGY5_ELECO|nr:hypothetical protein QOZ80_6AG0534810 [Eleusine coracana subsp. coracana]GJN34039.1 hypothetical protein PR202_gb22674 [Eleusine coracana subsp. coracana]